jgi:hypothetical protein
VVLRRSSGTVTSVTMAFATSRVATAPHAIDA